MEDTLFISYQQIQEMLFHFCRAFQLRIGIHDEHNHLLMEFPGIPQQVEDMVFCDYVARNSSIFDNTCLQCDQAAFQIVKKTRCSYVYRCHMGFKEAMIPIYTGDTLYLVLMIGQIRDCSDTEETFQSKCNRLFAMDPSLQENIDPDHLKKNWEGMLCMEDAQLQSVVYLLEICAAYIKDNQWIQFKNQSRREQLQQYFNNHYKEPITVQDMANTLHLSRSHLSRLLKQLMDCSFTEYLSALRIEKAEKLLVSTDMNIVEIAYAVGFNDPSYFLKVFKKITAVSPGVYRKNARHKS